jgi:hypothetical protein
MISTAALNNFSWCADSESFVDLYLWQKLKGASVTVQQPLCIGIKHGIGLCGGGGHVNKWASFNKEDRTYEQLEKWADPNAVNFYLNMTQEILRNKYSKKPFLSIITRVMLDEHGRSRRPSLFSNHTASVANLTSADYEHVLIIDRVGVGMLNANRSFAFAKPEGEFVMLLDDDDFFKRQDFIEQLKNHSGADVIFFKMKILTGDGDQIYPKPASWNSREPKRGQIGGSCFVVRKWVFDKYIRHFAQPSFGDWHFITKVLSDSEVKCVWLDELMCETGRVSRGAAE